VSSGNEGPGARWGEHPADWLDAYQRRPELVAEREPARRWPNVEKAGFIQMPVLPEPDEVLF